MGKNINLTRDNFTNKKSFILACIGSAVGMGNIWMFPKRVSLYGGGSFIIPYLIFVVLIASTGLMGEMGFGRATRSGPLNASKKIFEKKLTSKKASILSSIIGTIPVIGSLALAIGYTVVMGWILKYMIGSFSGSILSFDSLEGFGNEFSEISTSFGNNAWLLLALAIAAFILMFGVSKGIEKTNNILMPIFFALFVFLAIYAAFQPGAETGYSYIFRVDPIAFKDPLVWIFGLGQAFFSLSIAGNGTLVYGSYMKNEDDIVFSAYAVAIFDTVAAMLAALVIIPTMATSGSQLGQGGPGLMFIYLPELFAKMPAGHFIAIIFFVAVFFAGLSSLINLYEAPIATLEEKFGISRKLACLIIAAISALISLFIQGIVSNWMDFVSIYVCPLGAGLMGIMFFWIGGKKYVEDEISKGRKKKVPACFYPLSRYVFCPLCFLVLFLGIIFGGIG